jgi:hypothetical protein
VSLKSVKKQSQWWSVFKAFNPGPLLAFQLVGVGGGATDKGTSTGWGKSP